MAAMIHHQLFKSLTLIAAMLLLCALPACHHAHSDAQVSTDPNNDNVTLRDSIRYDDAEVLRYVTDQGDTLRYVANLITFCDTMMESSFFVHYYYMECADSVKCLSFFYDRYGDGQNMFRECCYCPPHYRVSPNRKSFFMATCIHANSNGWTTNYQLAMVDAATATTQFMGDYAAIRATKKGFVCAVARQTNEDVATCTADEEWVMHDIHIDWSGRVTRVDDWEYDYAEMERRYSSGTYMMLKGFSVIVADSVAYNR